jgi:hypothetical protein
MVRLDLVRDKIGRLRETAALLRTCLPEQAAACGATAGRPYGRVRTSSTSFRVGATRGRPSTARFF